MTRIVPAWLKECDYASLQHRRKVSGRALGAEEKYSEWRQSAHSDNLWLLDFYGDYLVGQFAGMGEALDLNAVAIAFRMAGIPEGDQDELRRRLNRLHADVMDIQREKTR